MSPQNGDRQYIGNTKLDQVIGRLLERSEQLQKQNQQFEKAVLTMGQTMGSFERTVGKLEEAVERLGESLLRQEKMEDRLRLCEQQQERHASRMIDLEADCKKNTDFREGIVLKLALVGLCALLAGGGALAILKLAIFGGG